MNQRTHALPFGEFLQDFADIDRCSQHRRFCFVLGSGCAATAGIPTGAALVDRWLGEIHDRELPPARHLRPGRQWNDDPLPALTLEKVEQLQAWVETWEDRPEGFTWLERAQFYGSIFGKRFRNVDTGRDWLRKLILRRPVSVGYHLLGRILSETRHSVIITTNFDRLVEDAIAIFQGVAVLPFGSADLAAFACQPQNSPVVAKIHGDVQLDTYNAAVDIQELRDEWKKALRSLFQSYTPIVIGYGGNDPGFMRFLIEEADTLLGNHSLYWTTRDPERDLQHPLIGALAERASFVPVRIPGYEEMMIRLSELWDWPDFEQLVLRRTEKVVANYRSAIERARRAVLDVLPAPEVPLASLTLSDIAPKIPPPAQRSAKQWREALDFAQSPTEEESLLSAALEALPTSTSLRAYAAACRAERNPADPQQEELAHAAFEEARQSRGDSDEETLASGNSFAWTLLARGKASVAVPLLRELVGQSKQALGPEHPQTLRLMNSLGSALQRIGADAEAAELLEQLVEIRRRVSGPESAATLASMNNLGTAYYNSGDAIRAAKIHAAVLEIRQRVFGRLHPTTLGSLNNLAIAYQTSGELDAAVDLVRQQLEGSEKLFGQKHPSTLKAIDNLASVLWKKGDLEEAARLHSQVTELRKEVLGPTHPETLTSMNNLAIINLQQGKHNDAVQLHREVLAVREILLGRNHPDTLISRNNLAASLHELGDYETAAMFHERVLAERRRLLGDTHADTLISFRNLALTLQAAGRKQQALDIAKQELEILKTLDRSDSRSGACEELIGDLEGELAT